VPKVILYPSTFGPFGSAQPVPAAAVIVDGQPPVVPPRRPRPQQPPGLTDVPAPAAAPTPPGGFDAVGPAETRRPAARPPAGLTEPPALADRLPNTALGGEAVAPAVLPRPRPQQPPGLVECPGAFGTDNTAFGGDVFGPVVSRLGRQPQQPPGPVDVPGPVAVAAGVNCGFEAQGPSATTRQRPQQPAGLTECPGSFGTANTTRGWAAVAPEATRTRRPQHPPGLTETPGAFTTTAARLGGYARRAADVRVVVTRQADARVVVARVVITGGPTVQTDRLPKAADEDINYVFDFSRFPEYVDDGAVLNQCTVVADDGITVDAGTITAAARGPAARPVPAGLGVVVYVTGGTAGQSYDVTVYGRFAGSGNLDTRAVRLRIDVEF